MNTFVVDLKKEAKGKHITFTEPEQNEYNSRQPTTEQELQENIEQARELGSSTLLELVFPYSKEERDTWPTQEREAREWLSDDKSPCTMIRRIAYHRKIEMAVMVGKIMENVTLFEYVAGDILGVQQKTIEGMELSE